MHDSSQQNSRFKTTMFLIIWSIVSAIVVVGLIFEDRLFHLRSDPIAHIQSSIGKVSQRPDDQANWRDVTTHSQIHDGDSIATSSNSNSRIAFSQSRHIDLGENAYISITAIKHKADNHIIVHLISGAVAGHIAEESEYTLTIIAGQQTFQLAPGQSIGIKKPIGDKPTTVPVKSVITKHKQEAPTKPIVLPSTFATASQPSTVPILGVDNDVNRSNALEASKTSETKTPTKATPPKIPIPSITRPANGEVWYTHLSLEELKAEKLKLSLSFEQKPTAPNWDLKCGVMLEADFKDLKKKNPIYYFAAKNENPNVIHIPVRDIVEYSLITTGSLQEKILNFSMRSAVIAKKGEDIYKLQSKGSQVYKIISIHDTFTSKRPLRIALQHLSQWNKSPALFQSVTKIDSNKAPIIIVAQKASSIQAFAKAIHSKNSFHFSGSSRFEDSGSYVVKQGEIVAQLGGSSLDTELATKIMAILKADFVFEGARTALVEIKDLPPREAAQRIKAIGNLKTIYAMRGADLIPLSKNFIETNESAFSFVKSQTSVLFSEKVTIRATR